MKYTNPNLNEAYDTLKLQNDNKNIKYNDSRLDEVSEILKGVETKKPYVDLHGDMLCLEDRLGLMITAAVVENDVRDDYVKEGSNKGEAIYSALLAAYKAHPGVFDVCSLWDGFPGDHLVLSDSGVEKIPELTSNLIKKFGYVGLPFSTLVTGRNVSTEGETVSEPVMVLGDDGLNKRLEDLGYKDQQWVVATIARNEPKLNFPDVNEVTVWPSSAIRNALEMYGIVQKWTGSLATDRKCAVALGHMLTEKSGLTPLQLDQHLYQVAEGIADIKE